MLGNHHYLHHQQQHNPPNPSNINSSNKPDWLHKYDLIGRIGEGTYGLVFLARIKPPSPNCGKSIAIKKFKQSKDGDGISTTAIREIMLLREISHENVVKLVNVHINPADMSLYLAFDYAEHDLYLGQLDKIFKVLGHPTPEKWPAPVNLPHWQQDVQHIQGHKYDNPGLYSIVNLSPKTPAYDLLSKMLEYDPHKRITAAQALEHEHLPQMQLLLTCKGPILFQIGPYLGKCL